jgi:hypothetical protein
LPLPATLNGPARTSGPVTVANSDEQNRDFANSPFFNTSDARKVTASNPLRGVNGCAGRCSGRSPGHQMLATFLYCASRQRWAAGGGRKLHWFGDGITGSGRWAGSEHGISSISKVAARLMLAVMCLPRYVSATPPRMPALWGDEWHEGTARGGKYLERHESFPPSIANISTVSTRRIGLSWNNSFMRKCATMANRSACPVIAKC